MNLSKKIGCLRSIFALSIAELRHPLAVYRAAYSFYLFVSLFPLFLFSLCEDTPSRPHATTTPYYPPPPRRDATTHVMTRLEGLSLQLLLYSIQNLQTATFGIFLIFFLIRASTSLRPFSIELAPSPTRSYLAYKASSNKSFDIAPFSNELAPSPTRSYLAYKARSYLAVVLRPLALEPEISLASLPIPLHSLADPHTLNVRYAVTSQQSRVHAEFQRWYLMSLSPGLSGSESESAQTRIVSTSLQTG